jgi:cytochrome P450
MRANDLRIDDVRELLITAQHMYDQALNGDMVDPLPQLRHLRAKGPVAWGVGHAFEGLELPHVFQGIEGRRTAMVFDYNDVSRVLREDELFIQDGYAAVGGDTLIHLNGPPHQRLRRLLIPALGPRAIANWESTAVHEALNELLDPLAGEVSTDLLQSVCNPFPVRVFRRIMDLPAADTDLVHALGVLQIAASASEQARVYTVLLADYVREKFRARRSVLEHSASRSSDLLTLLALPDTSGDRLSEDEAVATLQLLVTGGVDTTANLLANVFCFLLNNPTLMSAVKSDSALIPKAIEETLRLAPSGGNFELRIALADTEIQGVPIEKGTPIFTCETTANRDPAIWDDPDRFDLTRPPKPHLSFGQGAHMCIGVHLARMEVRSAILEILQRFPTLRADPSKPAPSIRGFLFQHPDALHVMLK